MRPLRAFARTAVATAALLSATGIATVATAPAAHADGCVDDYLAGGHSYVGPAVVNPVSFGGGVLTVDTNAALYDANNTATFARVVTNNEIGNAGALVTCIA
jgi:hypothetical protein